MKFVQVAIVVILLAVIATYARYESLSPCDWMEQDLAGQSDLPLIVIQGRIRANFLLRGIANPGAYDCVLAWWKFRAEGVPE